MTGDIMFNKPRLLTPGPTPLPERVRLALAQDMIHHRKPGFKKILLETETMLQKLFGTEQPGAPAFLLRHRGHDRRRARPVPARRNRHRGERRQIR